MPAAMSTPEARSHYDGRSSDARRLWVTWQHPKTRSMHVVGCLALLPDGSWSFWYVRRALKVPDFRPFVHFPEIGREYHSNDIFPTFANRLMSPHRPDYQDFLTALDLGRDATPFDILARSSGRKATDSIRVYPEPSVDAVSGITACLFLAHGVRHVDGADARIERLSPGDRLELRPEPTNRFNPLALLLDTRHQEPVGYVPDSLLDYAHSLCSYRSVEVRVDRVNPPPTPVTYRLLCWMAGPWPPGPLPFTGSDYEPIGS